MSPSLADHYECLKAPVYNRLFLFRRAMKTHRVHNAGCLTDSLQSGRNGEKTTFECREADETSRICYVFAYFMSVNNYKTPLSHYTPLSLIQSIRLSEPELFLQLGDLEQITQPSVIVSLPIIWGYLDFLPQSAIVRIK